LEDYVLKTPPSAEPITLEEVRFNLHVDSEDDNDDLSRLIVVARRTVETVTRRVLMPQTWIARYNGFPKGLGCIELPYPPCRAVTSVKYYDSEAVLQTLSPTTGYQVSGLPISDVCSDTPAAIHLRYGEIWPAVELGRVEGVQIEFTCGYPSANSVPAEIKQAMHLMIGHWYANKEDSLVGTIITKIPNGAETLLFPYRDLRF
jgi:uncharacterized phiE125 gp8 family phage protein